MLTAYAHTRSAFGAAFHLGEMRRRLMDPAGFDAAARLLPGPGRAFEQHDLEPISDVEPLGGSDRDGHDRRDRSEGPLGHLQGTGRKHKAVAEAAQRACTFEKEGKREEAETWRHIEAALKTMRGRTKVEPGVGGRSLGWMPHKQQNPLDTSC